MKEPEVDPRRLAALLDGRLNERERRELLDQLATSDEALDLYADAAAVLREVEGDGARAAGGDAGEARANSAPASRGVDATSAPPHRGTADVVPLGGRAWTREWMPRSRTVRWLALAASIAVLVSLPAVWLRTRPDVASPTYVALLDARDAGLPADWDGTPWRTTRGAGDPLTMDARAVRVGARLADLELLLHTRDARAAAVAAELAALLDEVAGGGTAVAAMDMLRARVTRGAVIEPELIADARRAAAAAAGAELVGVGTWVEAARVAAARRDQAFFRTRESHAALARGRGSPALRALAPGAAERVEQLLSGAGEPAWGMLQSELTALLRALSG